MIAPFIFGLVVGSAITFLLTIWFSKNNKNTFAKVREAEVKVVDKLDPRD